MKRWKKALFSMIALVMISAGTASLSVGADAKSQPIKVTINNWEVQLQHTPLLENGVVLLPLREIGTLMNCKTTYYAEGKRIIINSPTTRIEMRLGSKQATRNGKAYVLPTVPKNNNGTVYVPVRFVTEELGADVQWTSKEQQVALSLNSRYIFAEKGSNGYWLDKEEGKLYLSANAQAAKLVAITKISIMGYPSFTIDMLSPTVDLLKIQDNFGEPHLNDSIFKLLLVDNKLKLETSVHYSGLHPIQNIDWTSEKNALLLDGATLLEVDPFGKTIATHDLKKLTGLNDSSFQVELYDHEYMVVRPYNSGWLTVIDRKTNKATRLANVLLTEDILDLYKTIDTRSTDFTLWDGLKVVKRENNTLKLTHYWFMDNSKKELEYKLNTAD